MEGHWESNSSHVCYVDSLETVCAGKDTCSMKGMILPIFFEENWPVWVRIILYLTGIIYSFLGIFMVADVFMCAIDSITSTTKKVLMGHWFPCAKTRYNRLSLLERTGKLRRSKCLFGKGRETFGISY